MINSALSPVRFTALLWLSACATTDVHSNKTTDSVQNGALNARDLTPGECGLFIWFDAGSKFAVFSQNGQGAILGTDGGEITLTPYKSATSETGLNPTPDAYNQYPIQTFQDAGGKIYSLKLSQAQTAAQGIRYQAGIWRTTDSKGWDNVKSAIGFSTCITQDSLETPS